MSSADGKTKTSTDLAAEQKETIDRLGQQCGRLRRVITAAYSSLELGEPAMAEKLLAAETRKLR